MNQEQKLILINVMFKVAEKIVDTHKEEAGRTWYKHAQAINKYSKKRKPTPVRIGVKDLMAKKFEEILNFTHEYFEGKKNFHYITMYEILDYLINIERDIEMRGKFLHIISWNIREEICSVSEFEKISILNSKYLREINKMIERLEV